MPPKGSRARKKEVASTPSIAVAAEEDDVTPRPADDVPVDTAAAAATTSDEAAGAAASRLLLPEFLEAHSSDDDSVLFPDAEELAASKRRRLTDEPLLIGGLQELDESDSSEDEATLNRVGDIPMEWYEDTDHIGYDVEGNRIMKPKQSALDELVGKIDDPNSLRTIVDPQTGQKIVLSNKDLALLFNVQRNRAPNPDFLTMYADYPEHSRVNFDPLNHPLARSGPSRKTFVPKLHEMKKLAKIIARKLKEKEAEEAGTAPKPRKTEGETEDDDKIYNLWDDAHVEMDAKQRYRYQHRIPKPRKAPPGTYESYRPPPEYIPTDKAKERHKALRLIDRKEHFVPQQFAALRHVPFYHHTIQDAYQRCLDLSMFPRATRTRLVVDPQQLLPELPNPSDLRPFPEKLAFLYKGHTGTVRSLSLSPNGQYLATACDDHLVRIFEVLTGRLMKRYDLGGVVQQVEFCPSKTLNVLVAAVEYSLVFLVPAFCAHATVSEHTIRFLRSPAALVAGAAARHAATRVEEGAAAAGVASAMGHGITQAAIDRDETAFVGTRDLDDEAEKDRRAEFIDASASERAAGIVVKVVMHARVKRFTFHAKGDYMCALCPKDHVKYRQTIMLQISKRKVFCPFRKFSEVVTDCRFHPSAPYFFLSTTNSVRCYNLLAHKMTRRYKAHGGITNCLDVHPEGDNIIVGDTTYHTTWFDTDFSDKPYKRLKSHKGVVNAIGFHPNTKAYPLFATGASDGQVHVHHGMVYDDYNKNALIVPLKILKHRRPVYALAWHPTLPWVFTATEDGTVCCWTE